MGNIPAKFLAKMQNLLQGEYDSFMSSYDAPRVYGLRLNPLKIDADQWKSISPMGDTVRPVPWSKEGYYYQEEGRPGKHPHYHAGLYYIQEPSAMLPVELLDVRPGHRVLDLCAAPGGKSTQIAGKLMGQGFLVSNDNAGERTKALAKNIELSGVRNAAVFNEEPSALVPSFRAWFDRILVDAPCSGEGMFRKDEGMAAGWEKHSVERCTVMQRDILEDAAAMLAPGGLLVYSTCTFSPEENESQIAEFLIRHPEFAVEEAHPPGAVSQGRPEWIDAASARELGEVAAASLEGTVRLWPHLLEGEGHYAAVLRKMEVTDAGGTRLAVRHEVSEDSTPSAAVKHKKDVKRSEDPKLIRGGKPAVRDDDPISAWQKFSADELELEHGCGAEAVHFGSIVYVPSVQLPSLDRLRVVRPGWYVGETKKGRFVPSQALAMGLKRSEAKRSISWGSDSEEIQRYLKGETLFVRLEDLAIAESASAKGYVLVCVDGYPLGWGKYVDGMLKNELSTGWRQLYNG
ncbi:rRNA cytosine-C5-methyltransferase [Paenibacillus sp. 1011MAR3C5]|uniref:RsmF rRNA methyltransferase first C-terminal domain-containing protein n=1 Tax=Paenibacillus sp. 1011MAR3C5 TaxID=1675787 RepID=UPI000E6B95D7|nr:RsmB/NOP family class I SAM-dependent RNA methyltransferase [Paenibacillus sp. 1011MAR3C5]RJE89833.1 rRNA cytosine-C5-methyltransferase [Paenibacillus sp. 1011MAR3C5]